MVPVSANVALPQNGYPIVGAGAPRPQYPTVGARIMRTNSECDRNPPPRPRWGKSLHISNINPLNAPISIVIRRGHVYGKGIITITSSETTWIYSAFADTLLIIRSNRNWIHCIGRGRVSRPVVGKQCPDSNCR